MKKAQTLIEYALIVAFVAIVGYAFSSKIKLETIKTFIFTRPEVNGQIEIEAMTK